MGLVLFRCPDVFQCDLEHLMKTFIFLSLSLSLSLSHTHTHTFKHAQAQCEATRRQRGACRRISYFRHRTNVK